MTTGPRPAFRFIQAPAFTKAFFKVNHTTTGWWVFSSFFFFLRESKQGEGGDIGDEWNYNERRSRWGYFSRRAVLNSFFLRARVVIEGLKGEQ